MRLNDILIIHYNLRTNTIELIENLLLLLNNKITRIIQNNIIVTATDIAIKDGYIGEYLIPIDRS